MLIGEALANKEWKVVEKLYPTFKLGMKSQVTSTWEADYDDLSYLHIANSLPCCSLVIS